MNFLTGDDVLEKSQYEQGLSDGVATGRQEALEELMESKAVSLALQCDTQAKIYGSTESKMKERLKAVAIGLGWKDPADGEEK